MEATARVSEEGVDCDCWGAKRREYKGVCMRLRESPRSIPPGLYIVGQVSGPRPIRLQSLTLDIFLVKQAECVSGLQASDLTIVRGLHPPCYDRPIVIQKLGAQQQLPWGSFPCQ